MSIETDNRTKIKCSVRFEVTTTRIMQLDDIEFYLDGHDEEKGSTIDNSLVEDYIRQMWADDKLNPCDGNEYSDEDCFMADDNIREVVAFEIIKPRTKERVTDPDQTNLPLQDESK